MGWDGVGWNGMVDGEDNMQADMNNDENGCI